MSDSTRAIPQSTSREQQGKPGKLKRRTASTKRLNLNRMSAHIAALREARGANASVTWLPELSAQEHAAWEKRVRERELSGPLDWSIQELRKIREGGK